MNSSQQVVEWASRHRSVSNQSYNIPNLNESICGFSRQQHDAIEWSQKVTRCIRKLSRWRGTRLSMTEYHQQVRIQYGIGADVSLLEVGEKRLAS